MEILTAPTGFCMGIARAYREMNARALREGPFTALHQNSRLELDTLRRIERRDPDLLAQYPGLAQVSVVHDVAALQAGDRLVLGFHGLSREAKAEVTARGVELREDLICPFIAKLDRVVERYVAAGFDIAMVGSADNHHLRTARRIADAHGRRCFAIVRAEDIDTLPYADGRPIALVGEVTGNTEIFRETIARIAARQLPVTVRKTMCSDSHTRQRDAAELARQADVVVLVDDGGDGSRSVHEVCSRVNARVHPMRAEADLRVEWFDGADTVAVVGGIMVPAWTLAAVARRIRELCAAPAPAA